jgi:hypothetical protein
MGTVRRMLVAGILAGAVGACGDKDTGPSPDELAGTWIATKAEFVSVATPSLKFDLIARGATVSLVLTASKTFTLTITPPGEPELKSLGNWSTLEGDELKLTFSSGSMQGAMNFDMGLSGDTLTLAGADYQFDIDDNGTVESVKFNLTMARQ